MPKSVEVTYDPSKVTYGQLLQVYFSVAHNPTQLNYQGPDHGTQYRSTIFFASDEQKKIAQSYIEQLDKAKVFPAPIVTTLEPFKAFYPAEDYHQDFLTLNPTYPYIVYNDLPKVANLKQMFPEPLQRKAGAGFSRPRAEPVAFAASVEAGGRSASLVAPPPARLQPLAVASYCRSVRRTGLAGSAVPGPARTHKLHCR